MIGADTTFLVQLELVELPAHQAAHTLLRREVLQPGVPLALAPQVLAEFMHVITDPRRFQKPLTSAEAIAKARFWWNAAEVQHVFPSHESTLLFLFRSSASAFRPLDGPCWWMASGTPSLPLAESKPVRMHR